MGLLECSDQWLRWRSGRLLRRRGRLLLLLLAAFSRLTFLASAESLCHEDHLLSLSRLVFCGSRILGRTRDGVEPSFCYHYPKTEATTLQPV